VTALAKIPAGRITGAISDAAERWRDADFPARVRATQRIAGRTGYSIPVVEYALDRLFFSIDREPLEAVIAGELGEVAILDGFVPAPAVPTLGRGRPEMCASSPAARRSVLRSPRFCSPFVPSATCWSKIGRIR